MKKIILSLCVLAISSAALFAADQPVNNPKAHETFRKEFSGAQSVNWSLEGQFAKASFVLGGNSAIAWFDGEGALVGSMRDLSYNQLPLVVMTSLEKRFPQAASIDIREITNDDGTRYKLTIEHNAKKFKVALYPDGTIESVQRVKKG
ncbi:MAG TPA: hypothetical protein VHM26_09870 [Chitinophagaceae bacterium]|jgi:hypothetical protein|nr:hypothetical protein [Chitinophagaceae bacterium]